VWHIDNLLLSCRVFGRGVESACITALAGAARDAGCDVLRGHYLPTVKNTRFADFYPAHGFTPVPGEAGVFDLGLRRGPRRPTGRVSSTTALDALGLDGPAGTVAGRTEDQLCRPDGGTAGPFNRPEPATDPARHPNLTRSDPTRHDLKGGPSAMLTTTDFTRLLDAELGLEVSEADLEVDFDNLGEWDSVYLLRLIGALERATGKPLPVEELLQVRTLGAIRELAVSGR
jgi:acyl carrier protein